MVGEACGVEMEDLVPCGETLEPHCNSDGTGSRCPWVKCKRGHIIRADGHVMGEDSE